MLLLVALAVCGAPLPSAQAQGISRQASPSCASAPDPTGGPRCGGPLTYSTQDLAILAHKNALVQEAIAVREGKLPDTTFQHDWQAFMSQYGGTTKAAPPHGPECISGGCNTSLYLNLTQQSQATWYYCGPASASEALGVRNVWVSQGTLAGNSYLQTNEDGGTNWGSLVMPSTLNAWTNSWFYEAVDANSTNNYNVYASDLYADIGEGWSVVIGVKEEPGGPYLVGHPVGQTIYHWVASYGYTEDGGYTAYADSVSGTNFWSWSKNVPAYSTISSYDMWVMMSQGGFGWVW